MPNCSQSLLIAPTDPPASTTQAEDTSFAWDTVHQTVLQFVNPLLRQPPIAAASAENLLVTMQRLVAIINTLRSSPENVSGHSQGAAQTLETLMPYVSEEAYDVLDALREEQQAISIQPCAVSGQPEAFCLIPTSHPFITIETLIPSVLWSLARSSFSAMHLIEGIRAKCHQPGLALTGGMLRLVVMLEAETPTVRWCFDLATGYPAEPLLEPTAIVQSDERVLPIRCAAIEASASDSPCQVQQQLQAVLQQLQAEVPGLKTFLQGVAIQLLQPGAAWQAGNLRLRFGFAFTAQAPIVSGDEEGYRPPELIEAELMEETVGSPYGSTSESATATGTIASLRSTTQVSVANSAGRSLSPATLMRVTAADTFECYAQRTAQQQQQSLLQLRNQQAYCDNENAQLTLIVQSAIAQCNHTSTSSIDLQHPMLLMDELVPKLLWSLTSSTYEIMQLVGGVSAQVLQPNAPWQQGTLRLLAALHLNATDIDCLIDLSTGRSLKAETATLDRGAIVQTSTLISSQPTPIETVITHVQQQLDEAMIEYRLLKDGVSMAWLEDIEQDWQSGTIKLTVSLAFVPDAL